MEQDLRLTQDVREEMERHLASVAEALRRSGTAENEVQSVLQDVRNQVMELLAARVPQPPTMRDVREVIAGMAPPESYAETPEAAAIHKAGPPAKGQSTLPDNQRRLLMVFGFVLILAGLMLGFALPRPGSFPIALLAGIAGLLFVKWAVRSGGQHGSAETAQPGVRADTWPKKGRYLLSESHRRLLMVFGFALILAGVALTFAARWQEGLCVAFPAILAGLFFAKWAVTSGDPQGTAAATQPGVPADALPKEGRNLLSDAHKRLLMIFGFVLILAGLAQAFARWDEGFPAAILPIIVGLIFVKWAVIGPSNRRHPLAWSCLSVVLLAIAISYLLVVVFWVRGMHFSPMSHWTAGFAVQGSGHVITETRTVGGFSRISASGVSVINITQGEPQSLKIEADDNILPLIETGVKGDTLRIGYKGENWGGISPSKPVTVNVTMKQVSELSVSGGARIHAGSITADDLVVRGSGAVELALDDLKAKTLKVDISGSGKCDVAGKVDTQAVEGSGAIRYSADKLESLSANVRISGSGDVTVWAKESLDVNASGASRVSYYGTPRLTQQASGSSSITSLGNR